LKHTTPLKENYGFRRVYSKGKSAATPRMVLYVFPNGKPSNRMGITVSTKLGKAVVRNKVKRRFREIYRLNEDGLLCGLDIVIVARIKSTTAEYAELDEDFLYLADKLGILQKEA